MFWDSEGKEVAYKQVSPEGNGIAVPSGAFDLLGLSYEKERVFLLTLTLHESVSSLYRFLQRQEMRERTVLKIGEFARVTQVSLATLRYYDQCGLLKPLALDPETGYRYYSLDQLPRLNRILALKELGFALEQIAQLLKEGLSFDWCLD